MSPTHRADGPAGQPGAAAAGTPNIPGAAAGTPSTSTAADGEDTATTADTAPANGVPTPDSPATLTSLSALLGTVEGGAACAADGTCD